MTPLTCDLCGVRSINVKAAVVVWVEPHDQRFNAIDRCTDHAGCRSRVESMGEEWPIVERSRDVAAVGPDDVRWTSSGSEGVG